MMEAWSVRVKRAMGALGWPMPLMARELGLKTVSGVKRLLRGGRPSVDVLRRLQAIEKKYAAAIEKKRLHPSITVRKAFLWPPKWVECRKRIWVNGPDSKPAARPADLASLGAGGTDAASVLVGHLDPGNFPGRVLRVVDWTLEGRRRYAADRQDAARERDAARKKKPRSVGTGRFEGKK